jgi:hypothetical protein
MKSNAFLSAIAVAALAGSVFACDKHIQVAEKKSGCTKAKQAQLIAGKGEQCPKARLSAAVDQVMNNLPKMTYVVGDYETCCSKGAAGAAAKAGENGKVQFKVADKVYDQKTEAVVALTSLLEEKASKMAAVQFAVGKDCYGCPSHAGAMAKKAKTDMTYRLAGLDFNCKKQADATAKLIAGTGAPCGGSKAKVAGEKLAAKAPCSGSKAKAAKASGEKVAAKAPCCASKAKAAKASGEKVAAKAPCCASKAKAAKASGEKVAAKTPCCASKGKAAKAAAEKVATKAPGCGKAKTAAAKSDGFPCCSKAEGRLVQVQTHIRQMVEKAASALQS